jgi:excisionase family DNA binding protein
MALKSFKQAAEQWGVSVYTARRLAAKGIVKTVRVGRRRLIAESEVARIEATGVSFPSQSGSTSKATMLANACRTRRRRGE